jgi:hypothetical protein
MTDMANEIPRMRIVKLANPSAGTDFALPVSGIGDWIVESIAFVLTTSAVVANRLVQLSADDGTDVFGRYGAPAIQVASLVQRYSGFIGSTGGGTAGNLTSLAFPTVGLYLPQGGFLRSVTQAIDVGDQYSAIVARVLEAPSGPTDRWYPTLGLIQQARD